MCGIAGFVGPAVKSEAELTATATRMAAAVRHRGPDDAGAWADHSSGVAMGHQRLSVLDLSAAGHQPMLSHDGRYAIAFNGEIYNHLTIRSLLEMDSFSPHWQGHSDTETLLEAFAHWGVEKTLEQCSGMFAISLWDRRDRVLYLARDRLGEKPLYYGWQGPNFLFGSELNALRAHPDFVPDVDRGALSLLLRYNYIPGPHSIFRNIKKLPPGTWIQLRQGQRHVSPQAYWSLRNVAEAAERRPFQGSDEDAIAALESCLENAVRSQMVADVPLGALLSGGVDSTLIASLMCRASTTPVQTFTIGFDEKQYDEATHARAVASHLGTVHTELRFNSSDALSLVPKMSSMYDEPFADSSQLPTHLVMKLARRSVTVVLSGDGGDELFGGYTRYAHTLRRWSAFRKVPHSIRRASGAILSAMPATFLDAALAPVASRMGIGQPGERANRLGDRLARVRSVDDLAVLSLSNWRHPTRLVVGGHVPSNLVDTRGHWPQLHDPIARMMALDSLTYLPDDILVKVDRAAMSVSLESRAPFMDHNVVELAWSLPMHMKLRDGVGKWILRRLVERYVPRGLMDRPKMGFAIPLDEWLRGPLREWAESLLDGRRLERDGYLVAEPIRVTWRRHLRREGSYGHQLWPILMFQAWLEEGRCRSR